MIGRALACALAVCAATPVAHARAGGDRGDFLERAWKAAIDELSRAREARAPALVPPTPVAVTWKPRRLGSVDLKAPLLSLDGADLDGDGRAELVALTTREVLVIGPGSAGGLAILARASLPANPPSLRPRDPVGALAIADGGEILARSSESERGVALRYGGGKLVELRAVDGFPLCAGATATLAAGRNYFAPTSLVWARPGQAPAVASPFYAAACADHLLDSEGRAVTAFAAVATDGELVVRVARRCTDRDPGCAEAPPAESGIAGVGVAFAIADVDNDGRAEVLVSANRPPGDPDRVTVWSPRGSRWKSVFSHGFSGGVAGLAAADLDGDGDLDTVAAVRLIGAERVDLWALN